MSDFVRARSSTEAFWALDPFELITPHDPRFADIEKDLPDEHFGVTAPLRRFFGDPKRKAGQVKFAIIGHQGTGKTTLVRKAMEDLKPTGLMPIFIDALTAFDQSDFGLPDVMLVIVREVIAALEAQGIELDAEVTEATYRWFADELLIQEYKDQIEHSIGVSASMGFEFPRLVSFAAKLASALKTSNEYRKEIRQQAVRDVNDLIRRVNLVLDGAHAALAARKQQLCIILDNLEKIADRELVERAVLLPAQEIRELRCHVVLFLHPADDYAPKVMAANQAYPVVHVPCIPVRYKGDAVDVVRPAAAKAIRRLLDARVELDKVFVDVDESIATLARKSGGHVRDILRLAIRATEIAEPAKIELRHIEAASRFLAGHRTPLMTPDEWPRAVAIHATNSVQNSVADGRLLLHSCVLFYDGEPWWDVHPAVREDPQFERTKRSMDEDD